MEADTISPALWNEIYKSIRSEVPANSIVQGTVTGRDVNNRVVWVREVSNDPIEVVGHNSELTYYDGGQRRSVLVPPRVPDIGDVVILVKTMSDKFKCTGTLQTTKKWSADILPPFAGSNDPRLSDQRVPLDNSVTSAKIVDGTIIGTDVADGALLGRKNNWYYGTSPPASPQTGDIWLLPFGNSVWKFMYITSDPTYPWQFIGGPAYTVTDIGAVGTSGNLWIGFSGISAIPRSGYYEVGWSDSIGQTPNAYLGVIWDGELGNGSTLISGTICYTRYIQGPYNGYSQFYARAKSPVFCFLPAGTVLQIYYSVSNWDLVSYQRCISVTPTRIQ